MDEYAYEKRQTRYDRKRWVNPARDDRADRSGGARGRYRRSAAIALRANETSQGAVLFEILRVRTFRDQANRRSAEPGREDFDRDRPRAWHPVYVLQRR